LNKLLQRSIEALRLVNEDSVTSVLEDLEPVRPERVARTVSAASRMKPVPMHSTGAVQTRRKAERQSRRPTAYALANSVYAVGVGVERATRVTCARYCGSRRVRYMSRTNAAVKVDGHEAGDQRRVDERRRAGVWTDPDRPSTSTRPAMSAVPNRSTSSALHDPQGPAPGPRGGAPRWCKKFVNILCATTDKFPSLTRSEAPCERGSRAITRWDRTKYRSCGSQIRPAIVQPARRAS